jgi:hypothetical protein
MLILNAMLLFALWAVLIWGCVSNTFGKDE